MARTLSLGDLSPEAFNRFLNDFSDRVTRSGQMVGFDRVLDLMATPSWQKPSSWPPYNLVKLEKGEYLLEFALAGFGPDDLSVTQEGDTLTVQTKGDSDDSDAPEPNRFIHRGIAKRDFSISFKLAPDVRVDAVRMNAGILRVLLVQPEEERQTVEFKIEAASFDTA